MFYIIGLGLGDPKDVTVKGLEIIKACDRVYLESYTSILTCGQVALVSCTMIVFSIARLIEWLSFRRNFMEDR